MKKIKTIEEFYSIIESDQTSFVYFYTNWCPDCFFANLYFPRLIDQYKKMKFYKIDRDGLIDLSSHLGIYGIPSFLIFRNGEEIGRFVDKNRKSMKEAKSFIDKTI